MRCSLAGSQGTHACTDGSPSETGDTWHP